MKTYLPTSDEVKILGRTKLGSPLPLFWTASGVEFDVKCTELYFNLTADYDALVPWIRIEIDGTTFSRMALSKGDHKVLAFSGPDKEALHHIQLFRESQAMPDDDHCMLLLNSIEVEGELMKSPEKPLKIEFVGDSLTSGEGLLGTEEMTEWMPAHMSTDGNYALLTSRALNAELSVVSQCGWGMYHSWDSKKEQNIPRIYDKICAVNTSEEHEKLGALEDYDFSKWQADAVVINLGTNDASGFSGDFSGENGVIFKRSIVDFIGHIRSVYKNAYILYAYGMCGNDSETCIKEAVSSYKEESKDENVDYVSLDNMVDLGAHSHPGKKSHKNSADTIISVLKEKLK